MTWLRPISLALAILTILAPLAHILELPNKLSLDSNVWLAVQQHLYRGWGPFLGGPAEIGALTVNLILAYVRRDDVIAMRLTLIASTGYAGMLAAFFILNLPINTAVAAWTPATLPADWSAYRLRWETGHLIALLLSITSFGALLLEHSRRNRG